MECFHLAQGACHSLAQMKARLTDKDYLQKMGEHCDDVLNHPSSIKLNDDMSNVTRKPVFGMFGQVRLKPACSATEAS